jgi:hypothetical protein
MTTEIRRQIAGGMEIPRHCPHRACRRAAACRGTVDARGEPVCMKRLTAMGRRIFDAWVAALGAAEALQGKRQHPELDDNDDRCLYALCGMAASRALIDDPADRVAARRWLRRHMRRPDWVMSPEIWEVLQCFGRKADPQPPADRRG